MRELRKWKPLPKLVPHKPRLSAKYLEVFRKETKAIDNEKRYEKRKTRGR